MKEINLIGPKYCPIEDRNLFLEKDELTSLLDSDITMAHLLNRIGKFQSIKEAKKNGWDKPIPLGFNTFKIGKNQNQWIITIWNPSTTPEEFYASEIDSEQI